jgi:GNAT superfamily N-acetyltransferase
VRSFADGRVRPANARDLDPLLALLRACIDEMRAHGIEQWDEVYPARSTLSADIESAAGYVAAPSDGELAGYLVLNDQQNAEYSRVDWSIPSGRPAVVHRLMVHPARQHQGLGRLLMRFAERRAAELGYSVIRLDAFTANPRALRLYEALGYRDAGAVTFRKGIFRCFEKSLAQNSG